MLVSALKEYLFPIYILTILMFFNVSSTMMFWLSLEINMLVFLVFMASAKKKFPDNKIESPMMYYLCIQILGSSFILATYCGWSIHLNTFLPMILAFSLKMGISPFHYWTYRIVESIPNFFLSILLSIQKIPLLLSLVYCQDNMILIIFFLNLFNGILFLCKSVGMKELLVSSSLYSMVWMGMSLIMSALLMGLYTLMYFLHLALSFSGKSCGEMSVFWVTSMFLFLAGLPPFSLFFVKIMVVSFLSGGVEVFMVLIPSYMALIVYLSFFSKQFVSPNIIFMQHLNITKIMKATFPAVLVLFLF